MEVRTWHRALPLITACLLLLLLSFFLLSRTHPLPPDDALRHLAMGRYLRESGTFAAGWNQFLFLGRLSHEAVDAWWLADLLYAPLSPLPDAQAIGLYALCSITVLLSAFAFCLRRLRLDPRVTAFLLLLLLCGDPAFFARMLLGRPLTIITAIGLLMIYALRHRHWLAAGLLLTFATLFSELFVVLFGIGIITSLWHATIGDRRATCYGLLSIALGTAAGIAAHPHTVAYARYAFHFILQTPFSQHRALGGELTSGFGVVSSASALALVLLLVLLLLKRFEHVSFAALHRQGISLLLALMLAFFVLFAFMSRAVDFLWPISLWLLAELVARTQAAGWLLPPSGWSRRLVLLALAALVVITPLKVMHVYVTQPRWNLNAITAALEPLAPGTRVLNLDWSLFSPAVLVRPDLNYATGIDPTLTALDDPELSNLLTLPDGWLEALLNRVPEAQALVLELPKHAAIVHLLEHPRLHRIHEGNTAVAVFRITR